MIFNTTKINLYVCDDKQRLIQSDFGQVFSIRSRKSWWIVIKKILVDSRNPN